MTGRSALADTRLAIASDSGPPPHPPPEASIPRRWVPALVPPLILILGALSGCSSSKALRSAPTPEPPAAPKTTAATSVQDTTVDQALEWTGDRPEEAAHEESASDLVSTARSLYRKGLQLYVGGDNVGAEQALTDAGLAVDLASENDLTDAEEEELGLLQEKIAFFLDQLAPGSGVAATSPEASPEAAFEIRNDLAAPQPDDSVARLPEIDLVMNDRVQKWINYFTGRGRDKYELWLERTGRYRDLIYPILEEEGLPSDLLYLSLIESGMNPNAVSWAHAEGMWQFIKSTARLYNVKMDWWVDERRDPVKSCRAAAQHLRDLYVMFEDWPLALAAYNTGAGRVQREIRRSKSRNYWVLRLPTQTRDYVPEFMAAAMIGRNPERYGFSPNYHQPLQFDMVEVEGPLSLSAVAKCAGVSTDDLAELNPKLRQRAVPPTPNPYLLRVPAGTGDTCQAAIRAMTPDERAQFFVRAPSGYGTRPDRHRVRRGETLSGIARRYGTTTGTLARLNGLRSHDVIQVGSTLKLPENAKSRRSRDRYETREVAGTTVYTVRRGDTPAEIAQRFNMSTSTLLRMNNLHSRSRIFPGDELVVAGSSASQPPAAVASAPEKPPKATKNPPAKSATKTYLVRRGDTLYDIAEKYGTTTRAIELANGLHRNELIRAGDRLVIPSASGADGESPVPETTMATGNTGPASEVALAGDNDLKLVFYTVKRGDTLGKIASRFGVRITNLRSWNEMASTSTRIQAGQKLKIYVPQKQAG